MARVLNITSSPRGERSQSRKAGRKFLDAWLAAHPADTVTDREVGRHPPGHVTEAWIQGAFAPPDLLTPESRAASARATLWSTSCWPTISSSSAPPVQLRSADRPQGVSRQRRPGRPDVRDGPVEAEPNVPLVHGKRLVALIAAGGAGYAPGGPMAGSNFEAPYLRAVFAFMGVTDARVLYVENASGDKAAHEASLTKTWAAIREAVAA